MSEITKILIIDDHALYLQGMKSIIESLVSNVEVVSFSSIKTARDIQKEFHEFDLFIADIELPGENMFDFLEEIKERTEVPVLVISMHKKLSVIRKCKNLEIEGYLLKDDEELPDALEAILGGQGYYSDQVRTYYEKFSTDIREVSTREAEIIKLICNGYSNFAIAEQLSISIETVKSHKKNIKHKIGYSEIFELIEFAKERLLL